MQTEPSRIGDGGGGLNISGNGDNTMNSTRGNPNDKKTLKIAFLENENRNLAQLCEDLQTTLTINKNIIKNLMEQNKKSAAAASTTLSGSGSGMTTTTTTIIGGGNGAASPSMEYTVNQLTTENEVLEAKVKRITEERDQLEAKTLIMQQIIDNTKDKEEDVAEIYRDEIEELKENLERKEYLLQVNEQRYSEYERILIQTSEYDENVRRRLEDMNVVPKDRKISNVVLENTQYKQQIEALKYENEKLRD